MECTVVIQGLVAFRTDASASPGSITVFGSAHQCGTVSVSLFVSALTVGPRNAIVDPQTGGWVTDFSVASGDFHGNDFGCGPQDDFRIEAICNQDSSCNASLKVTDLPCQLVNACPTFTKIGAFPVPDRDNGCNPDGTRRVGLTGNTPAPGTVVEFVARRLPNGPDFPAGAIAPTPHQDFTAVLNLPAGEYTFSLQVVLPNPCPGPTGYFSVDPCPGSLTVPICPVISFAAPIVGSSCDTQDRRQTTVSAEVSPVAGNPVDASLRIRRTNPATGFSPFTLQSQTDQTSPFQLHGQRALPAGDYIASVEITNPSACNTSSTTFTVPPCPSTPGPLQPPQPPLPPPSPPSLQAESGGCTFLRIFGLLLLFAGLAVLLGGACSGNLAIEIIGGIAAGAGASILVVWALICQSIDHCFALNRIIQMLQILGFVLGVAALIAAIFGIHIGCVIGAFIDFGIVGLLLIALHWVAQSVGCEVLVGLPGARRPRG